MGKKEIAKYQHFVPQVYLRNFSFDAEHIHVYDLERRVSEPRLIEDVGGENYFNDMKISELKDFSSKYRLTIDFSKITQKDLSGDQPLEKYFGEVIEGELFKSVQKVIDCYNNNPTTYQSFVFNDNDKYNWSLYSVFQFFRTKTFKDNLERTMADGNRQVIAILKQYERAHDIDLSEKMEEIERASHKLSIRELQQNMLKDTDHMIGMANIHCFGYQWYIAVASQNKEFVTSDNPCSFAVRYSDPKSELYFPISNKLCFLLVPERNNRLEQKDKTFINCPDILVDYINKVTIDNADRIIMSKKKIDIPYYYGQIAYQRNHLNRTMFLNPIGECYVVQLDLKQTYPGQLVDTLLAKGFTKLGGEDVLKTPLLYVSLTTQCFRLGYYGTWYGKPINNIIYNEDAFGLLLA